MDNGVCISMVQPQLKMRLQVVVRCQWK